MAVAVGKGKEGVIPPVGHVIARLREKTQEKYPLPARRTCEKKRKRWTSAKKSKRARW